MRRNTLMLCMCFTLIGIGTANGAIQLGIGSIRGTYNGIEISDITPWLPAKVEAIDTWIRLSLNLTDAVFTNTTSARTTETFIFEHTFDTVFAFKTCVNVEMVGIFGDLDPTDWVSFKGFVWDEQIDGTLWAGADDRWYFLRGGRDFFSGPEPVSFRCELTVCLAPGHSVSFPGSASVGTVPETTSLAIWSILGGLGFCTAKWRKRVA